MAFTSNYRVYQLQVMILIHEGQDEERDEKIVNSFMHDISDMATGDVIVVSATPAKEVGR